MSGRGGGRGGGRGSGPMSQSKLLLQRSAQEAGLDNDRQMISLQEIIRPSLFSDFTWHSSGQRWDGTEQKPDEQQSSQNHENNNNTDPTTVAVKVEEPEPVHIVKRPASVVVMIQKQRQLWESFSKSSHNVRHCPDVDVARYGKQTVSTAPDQAVLLSMTAGTSSTSTNHQPGEDHPKDDDNTSGTGIRTLSFMEQQQQSNSKLATDERYFPAELLSTQKQLQSAQKARNPERKTLTALLEDMSKNEDNDEEAKENEDDEEFPEAEEELEADDIEDYTMNYFDSDDDDGSDGGDNGGGEATF
jgi:hypothetical protein